MNEDAFTALIFALVFISINLFILGVRIHLSTKRFENSLKEK